MAEIPPTPSRWTSAVGPAACAVVAPRGARRMIGSYRSSRGAGVSGTRGRLVSPSAPLQCSRGRMSWPHRDGGDLEQEPGLLAVGPGRPGRVPTACRGQRRAPEETATGRGWVGLGRTATVTARLPLPTVRFLS